VRLVGQLTPDLALFDVDMPGGGITAAGAAHEASPDTRIVMLTVSLIGYKVGMGRSRTVV
jgi:DNA-binding NarL/FixJ family response regulator